MGVIAQGRENYIPHYYLECTLLARGSSINYAVLVLNSLSFSKSLNEKGAQIETKDVGELKATGGKM